jgi:malate dehydrogenase (oxaloacetate-decarboxylating)
VAYTPGVAEPVKDIAANPALLGELTAKRNLVAVATDGTAILGLGDLGAEASIPVMEGKAVLFKQFGDVDGWPVPLNRCRRDGKNSGPTDPRRVIEAAAAIAPMYGGVNLERLLIQASPSNIGRKLARPRCFSAIHFVAPNGAHEPRRGSAP